MKNMMLCMIKDCKAGCFIGEPMSIRNEFEASQTILAFKLRFDKKQKHDFQIFKVADFDPTSEQPLLSCVPELLSLYCDEDDEEDEKLDE